MFRAVVRAGWPRKQEAVISLKDTRKNLQHATKSRRVHQKGGGRARSTGKSIDELKVTPCNRCGAIGHWEEDCTQPARNRKKRSPSAKVKGKSHRTGKGRGSSNYPIVEFYNYGSKTETSHMKVLHTWICGPGLWCCEESVWSETCRSDGTDMCTRG